MKKIAFFPSDSFFHTLHPLIKFSLLLILSTVVFFVNSPIIMWIAFISLLLAMLIIKQNPFRFLGMQASFLIALGIAAVQLLFNHQGIVIFEFSNTQFTDFGIQHAVLLPLRFLFILLNSYLFILTTSPSDLAYSLMQLGLPYRPVFMLITSIRLVPILTIEGERIYFSQKMRGAKYTIRKPRQFFTNIFVYLKAILYALFERVSKLAVSMENRSFGRYENRTYQRKYEGSINGIFIVIVIICISILLFVF